MLFLCKPWQCSHVQFTKFDILLKLFVNFEISSNNASFFSHVRQFIIVFQFFICAEIFQDFTYGFTLKSRARQNFGKGLQRCNSPTDWDRKLPQPSRDSASLLVEVEKTFFRFWFGVLWGVRNKWGCFCFLSYFTRPWTLTNQPIFSLKAFLETRLLSESLEPLIGF